MPRYQLSGLPPAAANGHTAFMPHYNRLAASGAMVYKSLLPGSGPARFHPIYNVGMGSPSPDLGDIAQMGLSRSSDAPNGWWQDDYDAVPEPAYWPGAGMPIQKYNPVRPQDTTMIPVPAVSLRFAYQRQAALLARGVAPGGQRQIQWNERLQRWKPRTWFTPANQ